MHGDIDYTRDKIIQRSLRDLDIILAEQEGERRTALIRRMQSWLEVEDAAYEVIQEFGPPAHFPDRWYNWYIDKKQKRVDSS